MKPVYPRRDGWLRTTPRNLKRGRLVFISRNFITLPDYDDDGKPTGTLSTLLEPKGRKFNAGRNARKRQRRGDHRVRFVEPKR